MEKLTAQLLKTIELALVAGLSSFLSGNTFVWPDSFAANHKSDGRLSTSQTANCFAF
jgi:hypothetical protein